MRRLLCLATLGLVTTLLVAPAAVAQSAGPGGEGPCTGTPFEAYIPEVNGCVTTEGLPDPGAATVYDADTREPIGTLDEVTVGLEGGTTIATPEVTASPVAAPTASATATATAAPEETSTALPTTGGIGGPALPLLAAALLLASGLVGFGVLGRSS